MYVTRNLPNTRIDVADALRGIAVAGMALLHASDHFDIYTNEAIAHTLPCDDQVFSVLTWLMSGKMYGIFAMLFGLSFFIMNDNQMQKQRPFVGRFVWRMCLLFAFGLVNVAFYDGDVLMLYALYGLLLIPVSFLPSKAVWCIIGLLAIQPVELFCLLSNTTIDHTRLFDLYYSTMALHEHGTFLENVVNNLRYGFELNFRYNIYSGRLTQLFCLFVLGMQLGRQRLFYDEGKNLKIWHFILAVSSIMTIILSIVDFGGMALWLTPIYHLFIFMVIVSAMVSAWYDFAGVRRMLRQFSFLGRMSLTNYLAQSVIGCFIFYGYGLAFYRLLGTTYSVLIGMAMVVGQYLFSRYWLKTHTRGPLEALWRKLMWIDLGREK